jgi:branched-chain amino acid transport system ATP-binding protein
LLRVAQVCSYYGRVQALRDVSLSVSKGQAIGVLGPNGAGKSTLLYTISGLVRPRSGSITYNDHELAGKPPHAIVKAGIAQVPEGRRIFTQLSVAENLLMGAYTRSSGINDELEMVFKLFPPLAEKRNQLGGELSGGQQQMLAIGRALMARPSLLLLDEPSLGLSPLMVEQLGEAIADIRTRTGMSILLVEQNVGLALEMVSHVYVMQAGSVVLEGPAQELVLDEIRRAYLGQHGTVGGHTASR